MIPERGATIEGYQIDRTAAVVDTKGMNPTEHPIRLETGFAHGIGIPTMRVHSNERWTPYASDSPLPLESRIRFIHRHHVDSLVVG